MIPDLRARLKAAAKEAPKPEKPAECMMRTERFQFPEADALRAVVARDMRRLGLETSDVPAEKVLYLDTETTGFAGAGTVAFLIGMGRLEGGEFVVEQAFMRDYPEEPAQLSRFAQRLHEAECIVTFNGKTFDIPILRDRFLMARMRADWQEKPHLDLLHAARRTWKPRLGKCDLGTLEREILGFAREDDIPGAEAPERYFAYLKTGDFSLIEPVMRHNAEDVVSLARLLARMANVYERAEEQQSMLDVLSVGAALEKFGEPERARRCYRLASGSDLSALARKKLAVSYARAHEYAQAAEEYRAMIARGEGGLEAYRTLAILYEWRLGRPKEALRVTEQALARFSGGDFRYRVEQADLEALQRRYLRLIRKA